LTNFPLDRFGNAGHPTSCGHIFSPDSVSNWQ
jgi:hypothetical protein